MNYKRKFLIMFVVDVFLLCLVQMLQAIALSYCIQKFYNSALCLSVLVGLDAFCLFVFIWTMMVAYKHFAVPQKSKSTESLPICGRLRSFFPSATYGVLPLSYVSWVIYVGILIGKLVFIFAKESMILSYSDDYKFASQILQITIGMSCIIFLLLVEGHNWIKKRSECYSYVTSLCKKTGIEIFDSVEILSTLMLGDNLPRHVENVVFGLAAINFFLPTIPLYELNVSNFGKTISPNCVSIKIMHMVLRLVLIDVPFLAVRFYLWSVFHEDMSVFMLKNTFYILLCLRELYLEIWRASKNVDDAYKKAKEEAEEIPLDGDKVNVKGDKPDEEVVERL